MKDSRGRARGGALLAVLWLSAALAAIAFSLAGTVRSETERASTALDGTRAQCLATGALERALLYMQWGSIYSQPGNPSQYFSPWTRELRFSFASGDAVVRIVPESSKLNVNNSPPEDLLRLLAALGTPEEQALQITRAIVDWRTRPLEGRITEFDRFYLSLTPSFRARHASFQEIEELLLVRGMTPELFHGSFQYDAQGRPSWREGLKDCLTVFGAGNAIDANTAPSPVLAAAGLSPRAIEVILEARRAQPFRSADQIRALNLSEPVLMRLAIGGADIFTLRATARPRTADGGLSDLRRSVGATVIRVDAATGYQVLRWQDRLWAWEDQWTREASLQ